MQTAPQDLLLGTAERRLLEPYALEPGKLERVFGALGAHRIDYADLYFQYARSESWSLEEGIVKSGSFNIEQGVGVRAIAGEKTAFAYSDEISFDALQDAARATRAIAAAGQNRRTKVARRGQPVRRYEPVDPLATLASEAKVALLGRLERMCRALDPRVTQVMAQLARRIRGGADRALGRRARGRRAAAGAAVGAGDRRAQRQARAAATRAAAGASATRYFSDAVLQRLRRQGRASQALVNLDARPAPAGTMTVVLGPGWPGILLHEAIGHGLEGDFNRKGSSAFSGRIGERVGARASRWSTTAPCPTGAARSMSTTRAIPPRARC